MPLSPVLSKIYDQYLSDVNKLVMVKTNIAGYFFDAILRMDHTSSLTITEHPVETGAAISDHAFVNPAVLVMEIGMSDVVKSLVNGQFEDGWSRSTKAFEVLQKLQKDREPLQVVTRLKKYDNMLIETIAVPDDNTTLFGLRATVTMREVFVAQVKTEKISARPQVTDSTNRGHLQVQSLDESTLRQVLNLFLGHLSQNYNITPK
jgi:hypothetical protein